MIPRSKLFSFPTVHLSERTLIEVEVDLEVVRLDAAFLVSVFPYAVLPNVETCVSFEDGHHLVDLRTQKLFVCPERVKSYQNHVPRLLFDTTQYEFLSDLPNQNLMVQCLKQANTNKNILKVR